MCEWRKLLKGGMGVWRDFHLKLFVQEHREVLEIEFWGGARICGGINGVLEKDLEGNDVTRG